MTYPRYTWILYDWYPQRWWEVQDSDTLTCTNEEMKRFLERAISFRRHPFPEQGNITVDTGIVSVSYVCTLYRSVSSTGPFLAFNVITIKMGGPDLVNDVALDR